MYLFKYINIYIRIYSFKAKKKAELYMFSQLLIIFATVGSQTIAYLLFFITYLSRRYHS